MANTEHARKLLVRSLLVTGVTVSTLVGAQSLAMLDNRQMDTTSNSTAPELITQLGGTTAVAPASTTTQQAAPNIVIQQAAPSIIILRRPGQPQANSVTTNTNGTVASSVIQPPSPSQLAAPQVVQSTGSAFTVQQPQTQMGRSSRR